VSKSDIIEAAGGLLCRVTAQGKELALIHRQRYDDWALPKGRRENKETFAEAAVREVTEETFCDVALGDFAGCTSYVVTGVPKVVLFWQMELVRENPFKSNDETDQLKWVSLKEAISVLDYEGERTLVKRVLLEIQV
jgi:8-oxo-dGTP diphosphatase